jgi:hypothetical protein
MKHLIFLSIISTIILSLYAQESIPVSGGNAIGSGGSVSYSIGQIVYTTNTGINGSVAQGVQQPYEISVIGIEETIGIILFYQVYPNPTTDFLTLKVENYDKWDLLYRLFDNNGRLLESKRITSTETDLDMTNYVAGIYFLKVLNKHREVRTFKIIKN